MLRVHLAFAWWEKLPTLILTNTYFVGSPNQATVTVTCAEPVGVICAVDTNAAVALYNIGFPVSRGRAIPKCGASGAPLARIFVLHLSIVFLRCVHSIHG